MARSSQEQLVVHALGDRWRWSLLDGRGTVLQSGTADPAAHDWPQGRPVTVLLDAADCMGLKLDLPELSGARLGKALRWAAEEHLAGSAEDEHVAAGPRDADNRLCAVVVSQQVMRECLAPFSTQPAERMLPDALCLPWNPGTVSLAEADGRILARWGEWSFGSFDPELAQEMLVTVVDPDARWDWHGGERPAWLAGRVADGDASEPLHVVLARGAAQAGVNLLSGQWSSQSTLAARLHWRLAAVLGVALVALVIAVAAAERYQLSAESERLQAEIDQRFERLFPDVGRVVRPREQAERELARLRFGQAAGMLDLMHRTAPVIHGQERLLLEGMNYRDGVLEVSLRAPDVAALDQLEQRLRALDLSAEVQTASLDAEGASGRIRIAGGRR